jgi:hypothetical protein
MAMGKRTRDRQPTMWVPTTELPTAASHPFYRRLNLLLREHGFDDFVEGQCASFYAETMGRPGVPPIRWRCGISWASVSETILRTTRRFRGLGA